MHYETLIYIALQASTSLNPARGFSIPDFPSLSREWARQIAAEGKSRRSVLSFPATTVEIGHDDDDREDDEMPFDPAHQFGWDVEHPRRRVEVGAFKVDALAVTNGEYLAFVEGKGVGADSELFPASWAWRGEEGGKVQKGGVKVKTLYGEVAFEYAAEWPVSGSALQLGAYAKVGLESSLFSNRHDADTISRS